MHHQTEHRETALAAGGEVRVIVAGDLDVAAVPHLLDLARAALGADARAVVLDLSAVEFLDCYGLRGLLAARALLLAAGCTVDASSRSPVVDRLLAMTSTTHHFGPRCPAGG